MKINFTYSNFVFQIWMSTMSKYVKNPVDISLTRNEQE